MTPHHPQPYRSACGIDISNEKIKWQAIQLAIHSIVGTYIDYENRGKLHASICYPSQDIIFQITKISICKYL